jgi:hypothetical protein
MREVAVFALSSSTIRTRLVNNKETEDKTMILSVIPGALTNVDTTALVKPGSRYVDENGKEYIYALGITSTVVGNVMALTLETTNNTPITARLTETIGAKGTPVCVALAATEVGCYGWFQVYGAVEVSCAASDAADAIQYCTTGAGVIDDAGTTKIHGIRLVDTVTGAANATAFITYPRTAA